MGLHPLSLMLNRSVSNYGGLCQELVKKKKKKKDEVIMTSKAHEILFIASFPPHKYYLIY